MKGTKTFIGAALLLAVFQVHGQKPPYDYLFRPGMADTLASRGTLASADTLNVRNIVTPSDTLSAADTLIMRNALPSSDSLMAQHTPATTDTLASTDTLVSPNGATDSLAQAFYFKIKDGSVQVDFFLHTGEKKMRQQHKRALTPLIISHDTLHMTELAPVYTYGRTRYLKDERENMLPADADTILYGKKAREVEIHFIAQVPYETWMDTASLEIRQEVSGCASCAISSSDSTRMPQLLYRPDIWLPEEVECPVEYVPRDGYCDAFLNFELDRAVLKTGLGSNEKELAKIDSVLLYVKGNPAYTILSMEIRGFASPEAPYAYNIRLAERRAMALKQYILRNHHVADSLLEVFPGEENWEDLISMIRQTDLPYKTEILDIIAQETDPDLRERKIKKIDEGRPYRLMYRVFYPSLRKNAFHISYISKERSLEEAKELVSTAPSELNVYEFYRVAKHFYSQDSLTYSQIIQRAADTYPTHSIANTNAAREALREGDLEKAREYLLRTRYEDFTLGHRAYMAWKEGRTADALFLWRQAAEKGDTSALHNLAEIEKRGY